MDDNSYLLELVGQTAENLIRKLGHCPPFGMYQTTAGKMAHIMPDTIESAGFDPNDRESFFEYIAPQVEALQIVRIAIATSAQISFDPSSPLKDAIVVHMETNDAPATNFIRAYSLEGNELTLEEPFYQETQARLLG